MLKTEKQLLVQELTKEVPALNGFALCAFQGLDVSGFTELRTGLWKVGATVRVVKNRLVLKALETAEVEGIDATAFKGMNLMVCAKDDILQALNTLSQFMKFNEMLVLKGGVVCGAPCQAAEMQELAKLPGFKGLMAVTAGSFNNILASFTGTLEALETKKAQA